MAEASLNQVALKYKLIVRANQMAYMELKKMRESLVGA